MSGKLENQYLKDLVGAINSEVDQVVWGQFAIVEDDYEWCSHIRSDIKPEMMLSLTEHNRKRIHAATVAYPSIFKFDKHFRVVHNKCPHFSCSFSKSRSVQVCAREVVRKVLSPWIEPWNKAMEEVQQEVEKYERFLNIRSDFFEFLGLKVPDDRDERGTVFHYPEGDYEEVSSVEVWIQQYVGKLDLKFHSIPVEIAKELMGVIYKHVPKSNWR